MKKTAREAIRAKEANELRREINFLSKTGTERILFALQKKEQESKKSRENQ